MLYMHPDGSWVIEDADGKHSRTVATPYASPTEAGQTTLFWTRDGSFMYLEARWPNEAAIPAKTPGSLPPSPPPDRWSSVVLGHMDPDGSTRQALTRFEPPTTQVVPEGLSPETLLFSTAPLEGGVQLLDGLPLYSVSTSGGGQRDLEVTVVPGGGISARPGAASQFAVIVGRGRESWTNKQLAIIDASSGAITTVTSPDTAANWPIWSPDGSQLAYVGSVDAGPNGRDASYASRRIWIMNADGSNNRQLTTGDDIRDEAPQWSADGNHILFFRLGTERCSPPYTVQLLDVRDGSVHEVLSGLPPILTTNLSEVGEAPQCDRSSATEKAQPSDLLGRVNFAEVFAWWQPPGIASDATAEE
jgi:hypothetical protein